MQDPSFGIACTDRRISPTKTLNNLGNEVAADFERTVLAHGTGVRVALFIGVFRIPLAVL